MSNETLESAVIGIIEKATTGIDKATDFLSAELPDVVNQLLAWNTFSSSIWFAIGCFIILAGLIFPIVVFIRSDDNELKHAALWVGLVVVIIGAVFAACNMDWLQIMIAPKVWLIEYAAGLAKTCS